MIKCSQIYFFVWPIVRPVPLYQKKRLEETGNELNYFLGFSFNACGAFYENGLRFVCNICSGPRRNILNKVEGNVMPIGLF